MSAGKHIQASRRPFTHWTLMVVASAALAACGGGGGTEAIADEDRQEPLAVTTSTEAYKLAAPLPAQSQPLTGAIYTTDSKCLGVNINKFDAKADVYLNGGPQGGSSGLPEGDYYARVVSPSGVVLGQTATNLLVHVNANGEFAECYQLITIMTSPTTGALGYDDTPNPGGEYKVEVSPLSDFSRKKSDNFKIKKDRDVEDKTGFLSVEKCYDTNADGICQEEEPRISGWQVTILDLLGVTTTYATSFTGSFDPGTYYVNELFPLTTIGNWKATSDISTARPAVVTTDGDITVSFPNLCVGSGGGLTLGFWQNKNGRAVLTGSQTGSTFVSSVTNPGTSYGAILRTLNLRAADGSKVFTSAVPTYSQFTTWLMGKNAVNMAYMLSVQLATMKLNITSGSALAGQLVYAPGVPGANGLGYMTVGDLVDAAVAELATNTTGTVLVTTASGPKRTLEEAMKNALDNANNNRTWVQVPVGGQVPASCTPVTGVGGVFP